VLVLILGMVVSTKHDYPSVSSSFIKSAPITEKIKPVLLKKNASKQPKNTPIEVTKIETMANENVELSLHFLATKKLQYEHPPLTIPSKLPLRSPEEEEIKRQMLTGEFGRDSTTYRLLNRNVGQWPQTIIVADLTTSMYPYSTQVFAWMKKNTRNPAIKGMVFFTDCDSLGQQTVVSINNGKMYETREKDPQKALPILLEAARNTLSNHDDEENDIAALLYAQSAFPEAKHFVLLADNGAAPKDMHLLSQIQKPVHVVLCGTTWDSTTAFQPAYFEIASRTKGSFHTLEDDLRPTTLDNTTWLKVGRNYYRYQPRRQRFKVTKFMHRPRKFLGILWI